LAVVYTLALQLCSFQEPHQWLRGRSFCQLDFSGRFPIGD
jgi:hypothetical protein